MADTTRTATRRPSTISTSTAATAATGTSGGAGGVLVLTAAALAAASAAGQAQSPPAGDGGSLTVATEVVIEQPTITMGFVATGPADGAEPMTFDILPFMAMGPRPGRVEALRRPEFIRRDLPMFVEGLGFDDAQATIAETLLDEYGEAFALAVSPLEDALDRYRRQRSDRSLARMLDGSQEDGGIPALNGPGAVVFGGADGDAVFMIRQPAEAGASGGGGGAGGGADSAPSVVVARSITVLSEGGGEPPETDSDAEASVKSLLERVRARLEAAERAGEIVTAEELVRLARRLRAERELLRTEFLELLELIIEGDDPEAAETRLSAVIDRVLIERELPYGRLGGESLDLRAALAATAAPATPGAHADAAMELDAARGSFAAALRQRARSTADREVAGLEVLVARERREERIRTALERGTPMPTTDGPDPEVRRFVAASRRELDARVAVRDERLSRLEAIESALVASAPKLAEAFRDAAVARAFPAETRPRWSERALRYAESLEDLDATIAAAIAGIRLEHDRAARPLVDGRIADRIASEPGQVREQIDAMLETERGASVAFTEIGGSSSDDRTAQQRLDRQVRERLAAVLTDEQAASLPAIRRVLRLGEAGGFSVGIGAPKDE